jgi:gamma-glutamylaminecyclotransferase
MTLVFVYGTLKRGGTNHHYLAGQAFIGSARTPPGFTLYELEGYPGMVRDSHNQAGVIGELWSVDPECLGRLDELEGLAAGLYRREAVPLAAPFLGTCAQGYLYARPVVGRPALGAEWSVRSGEGPG